MRGSSQPIVNSARYKTQNTKRKIIWVSAKAATVPISVLSNPIVWCCAAHGAALSPQRYRPPAAPFDTFHLHNIGMDWTRLLTTRRPGPTSSAGGEQRGPGRRGHKIFLTTSLILTELMSSTARCSSAAGWQQMSWLQDHNLRHRHSRSLTSPPCYLLSPWSPQSALSTQSSYI